MEEINPYASPAALVAPLLGDADGPSGGIWREQRLLVVRKNATLPNICVKSNQPCDGPRLKRVLYWHHPAIFIAALSPLIYVILALVLRKKAVIWIPLSPSWWARRRRAIAIGWGVVALGVMSIVLGPIMAGATHKDGWHSAIFVGIALVLGGAISAIIGSRMIVPTRVDDSYAWIKGVHPDYLDSLPVFER